MTTNHEVRLSHWIQANPDHEAVKDIQALLEDLQCARLDADRDSCHVVTEVAIALTETPDQSRVRLEALLKWLNPPDLELLQRELQQQPA